MTARVLVVGASGFLGRAVVDALREVGAQAGGTYHGDPREGAAIPFDFFRDDPAGLPLSEVDAVAFAAHVERTGHERPRFLRAVDRFVGACRDRGVRLVYVSSAGVFDGDRGSYVESDESTPKSRYGDRLRAFEERAADLADACILRTDYLFGFARGTLDPRLARTRERLLSGETVRYYEDMYKSPVAVTDAAHAVVALALGDQCEVVHVPTPRTSVRSFHRTGAKALGLPHRRVRGVSMPEDPSLHRDTSLRSERFAEAVGFRPRSVARALGL